MQVYTLSDDGAFGGTFSVELPEMGEGAHRVSLSVPATLKPQPPHEDPLQPKQVSQVIEFVYHVWAERSDADSNFPTVEEVQASEVESARDLHALLHCSTAVVTYHHSSVNDASEALNLASQMTRDVSEMQGHEDVVGAVPIRTNQGVEELWAIVDARGHVIGSVEKGQAIFMCENPPPYAD